MISSFLVIFLRHGFVITITLLIYRTISSKLSISEFGEINYILTTIELALLFAGFGVPEIVRRKIAQKSSSLGIGGHLNIYLKSIALCSALVSTGMFYLISDKMIHAGKFIYFFIIAILMFFSGVKKFFISVYESLERYLFLSILLSLESIAVLIFVFFMGHLSTSKVLFAYLLPIACVSIALWKNADIQPSKILLKKIIVDGGKLFSLGISLFLFHKIDIFILERLSSERELGLYAGMYRIYEASFVLPGIITLIIYPRLFSADKNKGLLFRNSLFINIGFSLVFTAGIILFSQHIISIILTQKFVFGKNILHVLTLGMILQAISMILGRGIIALQDEGLLLKIAIGGILMNISLNLYLIPYYGALGAAFATIVSFTYSMLAQLYYYVSHKSQNYLNLKMIVFLLISVFCLITLIIIFKIYMINS